MPDVTAAGHRLADKVIRTPLITSEHLDEQAGCRLWLKPENLQRTGSYKARGALLAVDRVVREGGERVITQSSGNHGIAVAMAAREHGLKATVVLPFDAAPAKIARIKSYGAEIVQSAASVEECRTVVEELRAVGGHAFIDVRADEDVIAGQGTAALELIEDASRLDALVVPTASGCGLAGAVLAARDAGRDLAIYGAEPAGCGSLTLSLQAGERVPVEATPGLADALTARCQGRVPFEIFKDAVAGAITVDDQAVARAFRLALYRTKLLLEPAGALALAAALDLAASGRYRDVGTILTGGNATPQAVARLVRPDETENGKHG